MNRAKDRLEFLLAIEIFWHYEDVLADGAIERKRGVEHQGGIGGTLHVLTGIRDGDGTHSSRKATTYAAHGEHGHQRQREQGRQVITPPRQLPPLQSGRGIDAPQHPDHDDGEHHEIPVAEHLGEDDAAEVAFVLELTEHGGRGAPEGIGEIGSIGQVGDERETVHHDKQQSAHPVPPVPFLPVERQQHEYHVKAVGEQDGSRIEKPCPRQHLGGEPRGEVAPVVEQIGQASCSIDHIGQQQVPAGGRERCGC